MRRSLLPNLVEAGRYNQRRGAGAVRLFEIGHVFWEQQGGGDTEAETVALVLGGSVGTPWERAAQLDFFDLKGLLESLLETLGVAATWRPASLPRLVPGLTAEIVLEAGAGDRDRLRRPARRRGAPAIRCWSPSSGSASCRKSRPRCWCGRRRPIRASRSTPPCSTRSRCPGRRWPT